MSALLCAELWDPNVSAASSYLLVSNTGVPFAWDITVPIPRHLDGGGFGSPALIADPIAFNNAAIGIWPAEPTVAYAYVTTTGALSSDGDVDTVVELCAASVSGNGLSPIVFDVDGSLFAALGFPPGVIGFSFIKNSDNASLRITESFQAYNGAFVDGIVANGELTVSEMAATLTHEEGHSLNFDHTQVNGHFFIGDTNDPGFTLYGAPPAGAGVVNVMFPFALGGGNTALTPGRDDLTTAEHLYGNAFARSGVISGTVFRTDGVTPLQGANIIARNPANPFFDAVSSPSGYLFVAGGAPSLAEGSYDCRGLTPGVGYTLEKVQINGNFTGGSGVGPRDPPILVPVEEFYNGANESSSNPPDDPSASVSVTATAVGIDFICNTVVMAAALANPGVCYASTGLADGGRLLSIDTATGIGTIIGSTGLGGVPGLAINSLGEMFCTDRGSGDLYRIDAATGAVFLVGSPGIAFVDGIAFDENDVLYGVGSDSPAFNLRTLDTTTGASTIIGPTGDIVVGLAFDPSDGQLYGSIGGFGASNPDAILRINKTSGAASVVGTTGLGGATPDLHFSGGQLYATKSIAGISNLVSIDKTTGSATVIGSTGFRSVSGLAAFERAHCISLVCPSDLIAGNGAGLGSNLALSFCITNCGDSPQICTYEFSDDMGWCVQSPGAVTINPGATECITVGCAIPGSAFTLDTNTIEFIVNSGGLADTCTTRITVDRTVPVTLETFEAISTLGGIRLSWRFGANFQRELQGVRVQRGLQADGPFKDITPSDLSPQIEMSFEDVNVDRARPYWYRLMLRSKEGVVSTQGLLQLTTSGRVYPTSLHPPFIPTGGGPVMIRYNIGNAHTQSLMQIYDVRGRLVRRLGRWQRQPGAYMQTWDRLDDSGRQVGRGIYLVNLTAGRQTMSQKIVLLHN